MESINIDSVAWKSEYNIGNFKIDNEHQYLFQIANKAMNTMNVADDKALEELKEIIKKLFEYVAQHFKNEEEYMKSISYPEIQRHKEIHKGMISMLTSLIEELNSLEIEEIKKRVFDFINEYFVKHIISEDKKIELHSMSLNDLRETFGWKDIYKVEDEIIDSEHKQLFEIASSAFQIVDSEKRNEKVKSIIIELYDYMKKHFQHEEKFMESIEYDDIENHKELHQNIISTLNKFVKELPKMNIESFEKELARIIDISLVQHIIQEDRKIINWHKKSKS